MMNLKQIKPLQAEQILSDDFPKIRYWEGYPRQYRFDASRGLFNMNGDTTLTKKGEGFTIIPVSYRIFIDDILGYGRREWAEFFFLNQAGNICSLCVHGYSVENLKRKSAEMYYDNIEHPCFIKLTLKPEERINSTSGNKYYIADFSYALLPEKEKTALELLTSDFNIYRSETLSGSVELIKSLHYQPPIILEENASTEEEKVGSLSENGIEVPN